MTESQTINEFITLIENELDDLKKIITKNYKKETDFEKLISNNMCFGVDMARKCLFICKDKFLGGKK